MSIPDSLHESDPLHAPEQLRLPLGAGAVQSESAAEAPVSATGQELLIRAAADRLRTATPAEVIAAARRALSRRIRRGVTLDSPRAVRDFLALKLGALEYELFAVLLLDARHRLIDYVELFRGTVDRSSVHPREVVKLALDRNAAALVLAHPHPSGATEPSQADELITRRLKEALALIDVRVLDHLIVAGGEVISFSERGLI